MIIILKQGANKEQVTEITHWIETNANVQVNPIFGSMTTILGLVGDTSSVDMGLIRSNELVEDVKRVSEPYKKANRKFHPDDTVIEIENLKLGGGYFQTIAGPCSVESEEQIIEVARAVKAAGAKMLRGGAFKPRTSPYSFQGMRAEGLELLLKAKKETGLPIVSELMSLSHLDLFADVDVIQIGARNMQNFDLLKELGKIQKPILLKRGLANTIDELLMSAEYIMTGGNENIILCERGIRTFETRTRNTLDLSAIPVLKKLTHLPVVVDPSHAVGYSQLVKPLAMAAAAVGADGLMIEVHNDPSRALCDGPQSLTPEAFDDLAKSVFALQPFACSYDEDSPNENKAYEDYFF